MFLIIFIFTGELSAIDTKSTDKKREMEKFFFLAKYFVFGKNIPSTFAGQKIWHIRKITGIKSANLYSKIILKTLLSIF